MEQKTIFERLGITYTQAEDGLLYPNLVLNDPEPNYGKYGHLRKRFLQEHRPALYAQLSLTGKLVSHLNEVDAACTERMERAAEEMAKAEGVTEALKEANQMEWVRRMNSIQNRAEEAALRDLIYQAEKIDGERVQEVEVYLNYVGKIEIPPKELTPEELEEQEKRRKAREASRRCYIKKKEREAKQKQEEKKQKESEQQATEQKTVDPPDDAA